MENLKVAFDIMPDGKSPPFYYTKADGHLIFDLRMTLERKSRWMAIKLPKLSGQYLQVYVLLREIIRIALTYAALNDIPVFSSDI